MKDLLQMSMACAVRAKNGGLFISRGRGTHPTRILDSHELIFVQHGRLEMWEETRTFSVQQGQCLHLWPNRKHGGVGPYPVALSFYWVHFEINANSAEPVEPAIIVPQLASASRPERLENLFRQFLDDQESGRWNQTAADLLVMLMLCEIAPSFRPDEEISDTATSLAGRADTYIRLHYDQPISTAKIAQALGYNPDYLGRAYHQVYGCTLTEAIQRRRIRVARRHLLDSQMNIEEIAHASGFADAGYFRRLFRRYEGLSPGAFRRLYARVHVNTA
ncbi:MAG: helix-turn-helix transcriptional regulator [Anaerolineae bacterium]|nr:helix-turn-helix transcriptional regulator [Anaerolineae bacterium]